MRWHDCAKTTSGRGETASTRSEFAPQTRRKFLSLAAHRIHLEGQAAQLALEQRKVRLLDVIAVDEFGDVLTLVHRQLDERIGGERTDD